MKKMHILCIGGAVVDIFARPDESSFGRARPDTVSFAGDVVKDQGEGAFHFDFGDKVRLTEVVECYGGGAANVAVGLSRLGLPSSVLSLVGDDAWGERILLNLTREGVETSGVSVIEGEVSPFSIILLSGSGERVVLHSAGVREHLCDPLFDRAAASAAGCIVLMHLAERGCSILDDLLGVLEERPEVPFLWNPGRSEIGEGLSSPTIRNLVARSTILHLNEKELRSLSGQQDLRRGIRELADVGAETICVTRGGEGSIAVRRGKALSCSPADAPIVDTTGAGDAFLTGFAWAALRGGDLQTCLKAGSLNSAGVIRTVGTQPGLLTHTQMTQRLQDASLTLSPFRISL